MAKEKTIQLEVPASLSEITLGQYQRYLKVLEANNNEPNDFTNLKMIEIFCGIDLEDVVNIPLNEFRRVLEILLGAFGEKPLLERRFVLRELNFGLIPNLDNISLGEYIDIEANLGDWQEIHKAMAVLYRPISYEKGEQYQLDKYAPDDKRSNAMKEMPLSEVLAVQVFFYDLGNELLSHILTSLANQTEVTQTTQWKLISGENGDGLTRFMDSLKEMSSTLTKLHLPHYTPV